MPASQDLHSRNFHAHLSLDAAINEVDSPPCETRAAGDTPPPLTRPSKSIGGAIVTILVVFKDFCGFSSDSTGFLAYCPANGGMETLRPCTTGALDMNLANITTLAARGGIPRNRHRRAEGPAPSAG